MNWNNYEVEGQMTIFDVYGPAIWCGKTSPEHSQATREKISEPSLKKRQGSQIKTPLFLDLRGGRWTPSGCIMGDGWSIAWRVHDAQFWGVPQRRKRIALVADFGGASAPEILFERESLSGNITESAETRKEIAGDFGKNADPTICLQGNGIDRADTAGCNGRGWRTGGCYTLNTIDRPAVCAVQTYQQTGTAYDGSQVSPTLTANNANGAQRMPDKDNFNAVITYGLGGGTDGTVGALCARDFKGVGSQYVDEGKCIIQRLEYGGGVA